MGASLLLLLLLLGPAGRGSADSHHPEQLQAPVGASILVQCHYRLQDVRARKTWCRVLQDGCRPLVSSAVDRSAPGGKRTFLTDLGGGLLQVEMVSLHEEDAGKYRCVVHGATGPQTLHTVSLKVLPREDEQEGEEKTFQVDNVGEDPSLGPASNASPYELNWHEKRIPLIWGAALLLGLLVTAVVLLAVTARRRGSRLGIGGKFQSSGASGTEPSSASYHVNDSALAAGMPPDVPHVRLDSPPPFDTTIYADLDLDAPLGRPPHPQPPLPPKVLMPSKSVTYATVIFPGGGRGGTASSASAQESPSQLPSS
uniref:trem-like transcript 1 protein isoform X2 n=1 Tax=Jaculus jaculus TaxID=51337 RepID=UPI001E1B1298|nr:trem-like transcript 1 protein isoform X2 [Jaculus jaculus]